MQYFDVFLALFFDARHRSLRGLDLDHRFIVPPAQYHQRYPFFVFPGLIFTK